ncbi:uncharacterized protein LOC100254532 isoform X3 [Vitis vinifera]|uniref:uncharacterized protein LOC100254532 isoform X3 n=1 Tax=Vitis vinifera TaxID=29760 RepID=UPI0028830EE3|nr:uncharacterized protein LOC100254532 isoform X3 [Vitis vinifera]
MPVSVLGEQPERNLRMVMKEKDEELLLFLEMRRREKEKNDSLLLESPDAPFGSKPDVSPISKIVSSMPVRKTGPDEFLDSENDRTDYDWLLTPPGTPLFPSLEMESQKTVMNQIEVSNARPATLKSRLPNLQPQPASRSNDAARQPAMSSGLNSSHTGNRRPLSSGGPKSTASRPATPTGRPTLPATSKSSRPSTPTSRATLPSTKLTAPPVRSSTPTRSTARSSTPTTRPSVTASKSTSRSATPSRRSSTPTPSSATRASAPPARSSSVAKSGPTASKSTVPSRGSSPIVKSRPQKPSEKPGFSLDAPPNLKTSMPERPASASRGRAGAASGRSTSTEAGSDARLRRQSCSPSRGRGSLGSSSSNGNSIPAMRRAHSNGSDNVSPVLIGTKMVERVVNMRKLAPPKQDDHRSAHPAGKSSSAPDSSGFGRTLSKKSLDMALRHMDIRRSIQGNLRPLMTNIPASSMYSVRSGPTKSSTASVSGSPLATSSITSSEPSVNENSHCFYGSEIEDDELGSDRGHSSPASRQGG